MSDAATKAAYANVRAWGFNDALRDLAPDPDMMRRSDKGEDIGEIYMAGYDAGWRGNRCDPIAEKRDDMRWEGLEETRAGLDEGES